MLNESTKPKEKQKIYILSTAFRVKVLGYSCSWGFSGISAVNNPPANAGGARDSGSIPGSGRSTGGRAWQPTPVFLPGKFPGQRSLEGYSPWSCVESDTTECTHTHSDHQDDEETNSQVFLLLSPDSWTLQKDKMIISFKDAAKIYKAGIVHIPNSGVDILWPGTHFYQILLSGVSCLVSTPSGDGGFLLWRTKRVVRSWVPWLFLPLPGTKMFV